MGQQQPVKKPLKKRSLQQEARIQGLYEMYAQSIRVSTMMKDKSLCEQTFEEEIKRKQMKKRKYIEKGQNFLKELLTSFEQRDEYAWGSQISKLFTKHFSNGFEAKWFQSKQFFYQLLLQNSGIQPQSAQLVVRSHLVISQKEKKLKQLHKTNNNNNPKHSEQAQKSFENYFLKIIKEKNRLGHNIRSSFMMVEEDVIDRRKEEEIAEMIEVETQRMTLEEEINFINSSIIDAEEEKIFAGGEYNSGNVDKEREKQPEKSHHDQTDDQYFLPLITKRHKAKRRFSSKPPTSQQPLIQMSQFQPKAKYSRYRLQSSSIIIPSTVFYQRMNFTTKVETDQLLRVYRQLSNTIQQTINSCNLISCPLKHFLLYFQFKTSKKNISQLGFSESFKSLVVNDTNGQNSTSPSKLKKLHSSPSKSPSTSTLSHSPTTTLKRSHSSISSPTHDLYHLLTQTSQKSEIIRKKRQYNTNYLLKEIREFAEAYTEFLFKYLNFSKIQQSDLENFINLDTVYGIVLRNIWNIVSWIAERGYEWEEYVIREVVEKESPGFCIFTEEQIVKDPLVIINSYAKFCNKDPKKIKIQPTKFVKAYQSLLKLKDEVFPQKYLKKIIIFYRQATKCCEGADDLISLYEFLLKNCILNNFTQDMHIFRMKNIIQKLIPIESSSIDGAGEIVYAWTTWNIILEMFLLKLNDHKQVLLLENQEKQSKATKVSQTERKIPSRQNQQKKLNSEIKQFETSSNHKQSPKYHPNPEKRPQKKLQY